MPSRKERLPGSQVCETLPSSHVVSTTPHPTSTWEPTHLPGDLRTRLNQPACRHRAQALPELTSSICSRDPPEDLS